MAEVRVRTLLIAWLALGLLLAAIEGLALASPQTPRAWLGSLQAVYGLAEPVPGWARADRHAHLVVSGLACLWFAGASRLFAPRTLPWLPVALTALLILADELRQLGGPGRSFEMGDMAAGGLGIVLAFPAVRWLQRLAVVDATEVRRRPPRQPLP